MFTTAVTGVDLLYYRPKEVHRVHLARADDFGYCADCSRLKVLREASNRMPAEEQQLVDLERHIVHAKKQQAAFKQARKHLEEHDVRERKVFSELLMWFQGLTGDGLHKVCDYWRPSVLSHPGGSAPPCGKGC
jgi:hypothetical protein